MDGKDKFHKYGNYHGYIKIILISETCECYPTWSYGLDIVWVI